MVGNRERRQKGWGLLMTYQKAYIDGDGNTYRVERAANKMFVCVRVNAGGNRKAAKTMGAHKTFNKAQFELDANAERNGWKEAAV